MGMILCEVHDIVIAALVTPDVKEDFLNKRGSSSKKYYQIRGFLFNSVEPDNLCWLSSDIVDRLGIPTDRTLSWDEFSSYEEFVLEPICGKCFQEWINKNSSG